MPEPQSLRFNYTNSTDFQHNWYAMQGAPDAPPRPLFVKSCRRAEEVITGRDCDEAVEG